VPATSAVPAELDAVDSAESSVSRPDPRRFRALAIIAIAQLMIVLDASVVTIALPSAQRALHIAVTNRQWVMTAYTLAFGGLLLLGGRIADYLGRKRMFIVSLLGFAGASALGGLAQNAAMLFGARALQGAFAAVMAPAALSLITVTFTEPSERARAFGVYGAIAGGGAALGLVLGGVLTEFASWRWTLLINVPIAVIAALAASVEVRESRAEGDRRYDIPGALSVTGGLLALVYGFSRAASTGWGASSTLALLGLAAVLLVSFVVIETRSARPLLPLRVVLDRNRGGSYLASLLVGIALFGVFLFLTYYLQGTLGYSALKTGFAFLPFSAGIIAGAGVASRLLPRLGARTLMGSGLLLAAAGLAWFTLIGVHTGYLTHILPQELLVSTGMGLAFVPLSSTALIGVAEHDAGVASAMVNATQQVGGSLGTALLNTIAASATAAWVRSHVPHVSTVQVAPHVLSQTTIQLGLVHGYTTAIVVSAALVGLAAAATVSFLRSRVGATAAAAAVPAP
jgi:EmrB/QacA subfamily drug resistance transporter